MFFIEKGGGTKPIVVFLEKRRKQILLLKGVEEETNCFILGRGRKPVVLFW